MRKSETNRHLFLREKYSLPPVPALGHVMRKAGNHHAGKAGHLGKLPQGKEKGDRDHVDASVRRICPAAVSLGVSFRVALMNVRTGGSIRALRGCLRTSRETANLRVSQKRTSAAEAVKHRIGIGGRVTSPPLPHHRTCGSASGGSAGLSYGPVNIRGTPSASK